ncbi:MAG: Stf0 family sulfotransferase [Hyphomicrobiales bacterium]
MMSSWADEWGLPNRDAMTETEFNAAYLEAAIRAGKRATGIFGLRLMRENLDELTAILAQIFPQLPSDKARFTKGFGHILYIHLSRENKVAQAISLILAEQTGLWHIAPDGAEIERLALPRKPQYSFEQIKHEVTNLENYDAAWNAWFEEQGVTPLRVSYERLSCNPAETLVRICRELGIQVLNSHDVNPGVAKLSGETNLDWMHRYRVELGATAPRCDLSESNSPGPREPNRWGILLPVCMPTLKESGWRRVPGFQRVPARLLRRRAQ